MRKCKIIHQILEDLPVMEYQSHLPTLPANGIYFFYEEGEYSIHGTKKLKRIVRVGTHKAQRGLRGRIRNHFRGDKNSSVFRKHLGGALISRRNPKQSHIEQWLGQNTPTLNEIEKEVTNELTKNFVFKCIAVDEVKQRKLLEEQLIATITKCSECMPSKDWLGNFAESEEIKRSGLWNVQHTTSNSVMTNESLKMLKSFANKPLKRKDKALFLIPCCSKKNPVGNNPSWEQIRLSKVSNKLHFLDPYRVKMIKFYPSLSTSEAFGYYKNRGSGDRRTKKVEKAWRKNLGLSNCKTLKAIDRYNGWLYNPLSFNTLERLRNGEINNVIIVSALMGMVTPTDLIPDYELMVTDISSENNKVCDFWKEAYSNHEIKLKVQKIFSTYDYIYCLMRKNSGYLRSLSDILRTQHCYQVLSEGGGRIKILMNWGRFLDEALSSGIILPSDMQVLAKRYSCKINNLNFSAKVLRREEKSSIKSTGEKGEKKGLTNEIRKFVCKKYIKVARKQSKKQITIRAGDVHRDMGLVSRMPTVCSALESKLDDMCNVEIMKIVAPPSRRGANFFVTYRL